MKNRHEESAVRGQKIRTECGPDRSSHMTNKNEGIMGRKMRGGPTDTSHSLSGAGEVQTYNKQTSAPGQRTSNKKGSMDY